MLASFSNLPAAMTRCSARSALTQEALAEKSGLSQQYISGLENGLRNPTIVTLYELASALEVGHLELLTPR
jgi:transcriptional regulator with XRE-family HTH domain